MLMEATHEEHPRVLLFLTDVLELCIYYFHIPPAVDGIKNS